MIREKIGKLFVVAVVVFIISSGCVKEEKKIWTAKEVKDDWVMGENASYFKSLDSGDILIVEDVIENITPRYNPIANYSVTYINFKSGGYPFTFEGNLSQDFKVGDKVIITLHIIEVEKNGYKMESFAESWDAENEKPKPIDRDAIKHA
ncbi:MAG TPA: hypothetical protein ENI33_02195 [Thermoplasmatales archaeon]|nr:hypothetical protein [Thermoplasmatales archaeon]